MATQAPYPKLLNMRSYVIDRLESRPGSARVNSVALDQTNVHSIRRLNDPVPGAALTFARVVGAGTKVYVGQTSFTAEDTGYSGNPLSLVPFRPPQSPEAWMYVGDSNKMSKVDATGTLFSQGIAPPATAPSIALGVPLTTIIDKMESVGIWAAHADASGFTASATDRINTTITIIKYDSGSTGWASVEPASMNGFRPGALVTTGTNVETVDVQAVYRTMAATTIAAIAYDSGSIGSCTIQPATITGTLFEPQYDETSVPGPSPLPVRSSERTVSPLALTPGTLVTLGGTTETVQVISVTSNADGTASFKCVTANTHSAGDSITILPTFRAYFVNNHAAGVALTAGSFSFNVSGAGNGFGYVQINASFDLSQIASLRPTQEDDELHLSVMVDNLSLLLQGDVNFDIDSATTGTYNPTQDFTRNMEVYFYRANDLTPGVSQQVTILNNRVKSIQNNQVDSYGSEAFFGLPAPGSQSVFTVPIRKAVGQTSVQTETGNSQWTELHARIGDLQRLGADTSRNLSDVRAIRCSIQSVGSVNVRLSSLTIEGSYGPDVGDIGSDYYYRIRGRSKLTGAKSNCGPPTRFGLRPHRQSVIVSPVQHPDPQVDTLDVFRYGGSITSWIYVGSTNNGAIPTPFVDNYADSDIANSEVLGFTDYQPFPTIDIPHTGTVNVVGTHVTWASGDHFNTAWAPGSIININGIDCILYSSPSSTTVLEIQQGVGALTGAAYYTKQPTILANPLPCCWGPFNGSEFGCGDNFQPGVLYWTNGNDFDSTSDQNQLEITSPSEPLMNGCMYDSRNYVFSSDRMFGIYSNLLGPNAYYYQEIPNGKGLYSRWAMCTGPLIWFLGRDGIYQTAGGSPQSITDHELSLLFPHDNIPGVNVVLGSVTFFAPDMTQTTALRLSYADSHVKFDYVDLNGDRRTMIYSTILGVWSVDSYSYGAVTHYAEEGNGVHSGLIGSNDGFVYHEEGTTDNGTNFSSETRMPYIGDIGSFAHGRDGYVPVLSNAACSLVVNADGTDYTHTVPSSGGVYAKQYTVLQAFKGKSLEFALSSTAPFTLFVRDCFFRIKNWADDNYSKVNPFENLRRLTS